MAFNLLRTLPRFASSPVMIRAPLFLVFGFNKETPKQKGPKGTGDLVA